MGYLEKLACGCIVYGRDAAVADGKHPQEREPIIYHADCTAQHGGDGDG